MMFESPSTTLGVAEHPPPVVQTRVPGKHPLFNDSQLPAHHFKKDRLYRFSKGNLDVVILMAARPSSGAAVCFIAPFSSEYTANNIVSLIAPLDIACVHEDDSEQLHFRVSAHPHSNPDETKMFRLRIDVRQCEVISPA